MADEPEEDVARAVLDPAMLLEVAHQISIEKTLREGRTHSAEVLTLDRSFMGSRLVTISPGTAVLLVSTDSELIEKVRQDIIEGNYERVDDRLKVLITSYSQLNRSHYAPIADAAHIVDVAIGPHVIAEGILLEDRASYVDLYPFMGGELDPSLTNVATFSSSVAIESVEALLVLSQPDLSDVERAALVALPGDHGPIVGDGTVAVLPAAWAAARGAWAAYQVGKYLYKEYKQMKARRAQRGVAQRLGVDDSGGLDVPENATLAELLEARALLMQARLDQA